MNEKFQKTMPVILSITGSLGVIATSALASYETYKNYDKIKDVYSKKNKKEILKESLKVFWPVMVAGGATIASIVSSTIISKKYEASLTATALMLDGAYRKYKGKVQKVLGSEEAKKITKAIAKDDYKKEKKNISSNVKDGETLYWEEHIGYFSAKPEDFAKATMISTERIMGVDNYGENGIHTDCWTSFRVFLEDAHATIINNEGIDDISYDYGWHFDYLNEAYFGNMFLHYTKEPVYDEETGVLLYYIVTFDKDPVFAAKRDSRVLSGGYDVNQIDEFINEEDDAFKSYCEADVKCTEQMEEVINVNKD